jgi:translocation and assembly module TamB
VDSEVEQPKDEWQMRTSLRVELGDDVRVDGYGLTGYLRGALQVESRPASYMSGRGELSLVDGEFSVYGRSLNIVRGKILFGDGPIDNPAIDVRAQKKVGDEGLSGGGWTVGVDVNGTAQELEFNLFSDPYLEDSDILAYMVVGHSMSDVAEGEDSLLGAAATALGLEKSAGLVDSLTSLLPVDEMHLKGTMEEDISLVVGKHITDDLFIGYDHNFFKQQGEVTVRYNLGYGFSAETRSSASATGADLFFTIER